MAERANFVEEGYERVQTAFRSVEEDFQKLQKQIDRRRATFNKRADKQIKKFRKELRKNPVVKRAESVRSDWTKQMDEQGKRIEKSVEHGLEAVLNVFQIPSRNDLGKINKKLDKISRRINALDMTINQGDKAAPARPKKTTAN
jgi:small-conductance mechanosensitive channel